MNLTSDDSPRLLDLASAAAAAAAFASSAGLLFFAK